MSDEFKLIDDLQMNGKCYFVDILPQIMDNKEFFKLEDYLISTYLDEFSKKISNIVIKLICYYNSKIYLIGSDSNCDNNNLKSLINQDIRNKTLFEIADIIKYVILNDKLSVQIIFAEIPFLISINGAFSVDIYNIDIDIKCMNLIEALVNQENLFLKVT